MSKGNIYKINREGYSNDTKKNDIIEFLVGILVYAVVLEIANLLFKGIYIENFLYAFIAALILSLLNYSIKPLLIYWTLPLTISTLGLCYPIVNMIILKLCSLLMGNSFVVSGFFNLFFIAIFISVLRLFLDNMITKKVGNHHE